MIGFKQKFGVTPMFLILFTILASMATGMIVLAFPDLMPFIYPVPIPDPRIDILYQHAIDGHFLDHQAKYLAELFDWPMAPWWD